MKRAFYLPHKISSGSCKKDDERDCHVSQRPDRTPTRDFLARPATEFPLWPTFVLLTLPIVNHWVI
ncbi:MAG: hypothetical protein EOO62_26215 [Hymenobacter sp.]|nr:MAG: hypothetical protein EOO62_26215 [Hymenobacter sp.]